MTDAPLAIVLAAGLSTRMKSKTPKVLHPIAGRPLLAHVLDTVRAAGALPLVVLSKDSEPARAMLDGSARVALQDPPRGTGDAVRVALAEANGERGVAYIVYGDTPLLRAETLASLGALLAERHAMLAILAGEVGTDNAYGRIVRDKGGDVERIVEARLASAEEKLLPESILGAYAADLGWLREAVARLRPNATGEIFLTDLVAEATREGKRVAVHRTGDPEEGMGVNTRVELAAAEAALRRRIREDHMLAGVTFRDPESCQVDADVRIAADVVIDRGTILEGKTQIGAGSRVGPYAILRDTTVGERCRVENSTLEGATLEDEVTVGPYSHLRAPVGALPRRRARHPLRERSRVAHDPAAAAHRGARGARPARPARRDDGPPGDRIPGGDPSRGVLHRLRVLRHIGRVRRAPPLGSAAFRLRPRSAGRARRGPPSRGDPQRHHQGRPLAHPGLRGLARQHHRDPLCEGSLPAPGPR